jgi:ABC-type phosphate transport system substrate-binding protein
MVWMRASERRTSTVQRRARTATLLAVAALVVGEARSAADSGSPEVVVVVAAGQPVETLARTELADIFLGRASRFPDGRPAVPIDQREGSPARAVFYTAFLGRSAAQMKAHWSKIVFTGRGSPPREAPDGAAVRQLIAEDPQAIGYLDRDLVDASLRIVGVE